MEYDAEQITVMRIRQQALFKDKKVLEIGCGEGKLSSLLAADTRSYMAIDPDENLIREAKKKYGKVDFRIGSGESLGLEDHQFDLVLFTLSLHHQDSPVALKEAHRVLRHKGKLIVVEPSVDGEFQQFFHLFDDETVTIQFAYQSMINSAFVLEDKSSFEAIARFEGKTDLCQYDFDRKRVALGDEDRILHKLEQLQPGASSRSPILLKDRLEVYLMAKI